MTKSEVLERNDEQHQRQQKLELEGLQHRIFNEQRQKILQQ